MMNLEDENIKKATDIENVHRRDIFRDMKNEEFPNSTIDEIESHVTSYFCRLREYTINQNKGFREDLMFSVDFSFQKETKRTKSEETIESYLRTNIRKSVLQAILNRARKFFYVYKSVPKSRGSFTSVFYFNNEAESVKQEGYTIFESIKRFNEICMVRKYKHYKIVVEFENDEENEFNIEKEEFIKQYELIGEKNATQDILIEKLQELQIEKKRGE